jgi:cyclophilin family peptidyl-prolyl cis-trans isomerase
LLRVRLPLPLLCAILLAWPAASPASVFVRMYTPLGDIDLELLDGAAPAHVQNFLDYMRRRAYDDTFWHRSVPGFVIQGGGYWPNSTGFVTAFVAIPEDPPVVNQYNQSNLRGTIAMARLGGQPDSATSQWFINLADNVALDTVDGVGNGFTVFGRVINGTMPVVDAIAALPRYDAIAAFGPAFGELPLLGYAGGPLHHAHLVSVSRTVLVADGQCGDVNDDQVVDDDDLSYYRSHLANAAAFPLALDQCSVAGTPTSCDLVDVVVMRRDLAFLGPGMAPVCPAGAP